MMSESSKLDSAKPERIGKEIFCDLDDKFICGICHLVLEDPVQSHCGHRFCKACLDKHLSTSKEECPQCIEENNGEENDLTKEKIFPDNAIKREIASAKVRCVNSGCDWKGLFKDYENHCNECLCRLVQCRHCGNRMNQDQLTVHEAKCQLCEKSLKCVDIQFHNENECPKASITCALCQQKGVVREKISEHQETDGCGGEKMQCPVGCGTFERRQYHKHFNELKHSSWLIQQVMTLFAFLTNIQTEMHDKTATLKKELGKVMSTFEAEQTVLNGKLTDIQNRGLKEGDDDSNRNNLDGNIRQRVELFLRPINEKLDIKVGTFDGIVNALHREFEKLLSEMEKMKRNQQEVKAENDDLRTKLELMERNRNLPFKGATFRYLKSEEVPKFDGVLLWKISDFSKKRRDAIEGHSLSISSPPFYTSQYGYKMCARLYPNGDGMGKGSHLSLFFVVMKGDYDALLKWPFGQRVTFSLINQAGGQHIVDSFRPDVQSSSFKRPTMDMNIASGCPLFARLESLQNAGDGFLIDDNLFLKITVATLDLKDPGCS